jgi:hypothetical protein
MITISTSKFRPDVSVPFFFEAGIKDQEYEEHFKSKYVDARKVLKYEKEMSEDKLTYTTHVTWATPDAFTEYMSDPICNKQFLNVVSEYDQRHGIVSKSVDRDTGFIRPTWKQVHAEDYFKHIQIPDDWDSLEDFVDWYCDQRMPLMIPWDARVIRSDDAVAICLFRKGNYQVEFYIEYPNMYIYKHSHPRMEVITMTLGGGSNWPTVPDSTTNTSNIWGGLAIKLADGNYHGGDGNSETGNGFALLAFQRWDNPSEMTSAAVQWKGGTQGDIQSDLIKSHFPNALIQEGYADITSSTDIT